VLTTFLFVTLAFHTLLAFGVFLHARSRGRPAGRWIAVTLAFGIGGVAGYVIERR
jgi:hypothetical protein